MEVKDYARSLYEARLEAEFYANYHTRHVRFWRKFRGFSRFLTTLAGSSAAAGWLAAKPEFAGLSGLAVAVIVAIEQAAEPAEQLSRHREMMRRYRTLLADQDDDLSAFELNLQAIHADVDAPGFDGLRTPAFNDVLRAAGRNDYLLPESTWNKVVGFLA